MRALVDLPGQTSLAVQPFKSPLALLSIEPWNPLLGEFGQFLFSNHFVSVAAAVQVERERFPRICNVKRTGIMRPPR